MPQLSRGWIAFLLFLVACDGVPDPRTVDGALAYIARCVEQDDARSLYRVVDERARHAMISIVHDRREAARLVRESYPAPDQASTLASLGEAAEARDAADLFARRCDAACRSALGERVGAPAEVHEEGPITVVITTRGATLRFYRKGPGAWYGLEWHTEELSAERDRANRDLAIIRQNAETFARRRALETSPAP